MNSVHKLNPTHFGSASRLLADSFYDNPAHIYICPNEDTRRVNLQWLLGGNLRIQPDLTNSFCLIEGNRAQAMGFWTNSNNPSPSTWRKIKSGLLGAPIRLGVGGVRRLAEVTSGIEQHIQRALGSQPYWYLNNMVLAESLRGRGIGTRILTQQLALLEAEVPPIRTALATQRPQNVIFYERMGFRIALEDKIGTGENKFTNWIMERTVAA